jgi:trehalose 6-phosphate synthase/phosphatase
MPQVIIVSNRLPVTVTKTDGVLAFEASMGGVATGLSSYVKNRKNKWIGWPGIPTEDLTEANKRAITKELAKRNCAPVFLDRKQLEDFYNGYSNSLLWPIFHNLPLDKELHDERWWRAYKAVNKAFADAVLGAVQHDSVIWVHDYQLMLLPELLKAELPYNHIGFFLHIPFPTAKSFAKLAQGTRLLAGLLGADLIGFHTKSYVKNFLSTVQSLDLGVPSDGQLIVLDRAIRVVDFPMGIDYEKFAHARNLPAVKKSVKELRRKYRGKRVIAAVDRLDISKGFIERLRAYQVFLTNNPKLLGKVIFVLVGAPSRSEIAAYQKLSKRVDEMVATINNEFSTPRWQPVEYVNRAIPFEEVSALFQVADIAFIAPLRDGMNLVAKEFIASKSKHGILILSDTAGAAQEMQDALLVSHKKPASLVAALEQAMGMRKREAHGRFTRMQKHLSSNTVYTWAGDFMQTLQTAPLPGVPHLLTHTLSPRLEANLHKQYSRAHKRLLLLDYDGTLVPFTGHYMAFKPSQSLQTLLKRLAADDKNDVVLISGRSADDLDTRFAGLRLNLVAEHGAMTKRAGSKNWHTLARAESRWKRQILPILHKYTALTPQAIVEEKPHSLVWHYRQSPPYYAQKHAVILKRLLRPILKTYGLAMFQGSKIIEIKNPSINKGAALQPWLKNKYDFILTIGDDYTDEDMFTAVPLSANSIKIGHGTTKAKYRLADSKETVSLLHRLIR